VADLQGRRPIRRLKQRPPGRMTRRRGACLTLAPLLCLFGAGPLVAQAPAEAPSAGARAMLEFDLRVAEMASRTGLVGGARGLVEIWPHLSVGVGGHQVLKRLDDVPSRTGPGRTMAFAYAGVVVDVHLPALPLSLRMLTGAGTVTVRDAAVGTRIGSDIVMVLEPELVAEVVRLGAFAITAGAGYRLTLSVDGPARITREDVSTPFLSLSLRVGPL
jgi:hypothetical protein